ncbi:hypothetical protein SAMN05444370_1223 [Rubrimonas cliftonensis]|uniref:Uncharacterized protein n=1 Tax=Rubrimonas cliftonensis TaxID=89524 RepID=A0A1H4FH91_9RHOB|nr:hypothetical protein SAMN05444370_1223 [Rubrimonas cliftonensis]
MRRAECTPYSPRAVQAAAPVAPGSGQLRHYGRTLWTAVRASGGRILNNGRSTGQRVVTEARGCRPRVGPSYARGGHARRCEYTLKYDPVWTRRINRLLRRIAAGSLADQHPNDPRPPQASVARRRGLAPRDPHPAATPANPLRRCMIEMFRADYRVTDKNSSLTRPFSMLSAELSKSTILIFFGSDPFLYSLNSAVSEVLRVIINAISKKARSVGRLSSYTFRLSRGSSGVWRSSSTLVREKLSLTLALILFRASVSLAFSR